MAPTAQQVVSVPRRSGLGTEKSSCPTGVQTPNRPARMASLQLLRYLGDTWSVQNDFTFFMFHSYSPDNSKVYDFFFRPMNRISVRFQADALATRLWLFGTQNPKSGTEVSEKHSG